MFRPVRNTVRLRVDCWAKTYHNRMLRSSTYVQIFLEKKLGLEKTRLSELTPCDSIKSLYYLLYSPFALYEYWPVCFRERPERNLSIARHPVQVEDLLSIPQSGGKMSKRLGGIIGCKYKTSFPDGSNIGSTTV